MVGLSCELEFGGFSKVSGYVFPPLRRRGHAIARSQRDACCWKGWVPCHGAMVGLHGPTSAPSLLCRWQSLWVLSPPEWRVRNFPSAGGDRIGQAC